MRNRRKETEATRGQKKTVGKTGRGRGAGKDVREVRLLLPDELGEAAEERG